MDSEQTYYVDKINKYIKEYKISKKEFAKLINQNPTQLSKFLNQNSWKGFKIYQTIMRFFWDYDWEINRKNNLEKYGLEISNSAILDIKMLCENIEKSLNESSNKVHIFIEEENWSENGDVVQFVKKYDINIEIDNYRKMRICTDSDMNVNIYLDWDDKKKARKLIENAKIFY